MSTSIIRQEFQSDTGGPIIAIDTHLDSTTGLRFILWRHIVSAFNDPLRVQDQDCLVSFMLDANFQDIIPERIEFRPGVVLQVIQRQETPVDLVPKRPSLHKTHLQRTPSGMLAHELVARIGQEMDLYSASRRSFSMALSSGKTGLASSELESMKQYCERIQTGVDETKYLAGQSLENQDAMMAMQRRAEGIHEQMKEMQEELLVMQSEANVKQLAMLKLQDEASRKQEKILELQEKMVGMQQEALDRLAIIHGRIQALITQTYELHEYPIPRLFIVLPKEPELWDQLNPFMNKFRLYFLCECGEHTQKSGSNIPHHVHLARHEGYDLERPTKFFEKYGSYLLTMMEMLKYGVVAAGIIVPSLSQFDIVDSMSGMKEGLKFAKEAFVPLVNDTISHLQDRLQMDPVIGEPGVDGFQSSAEALEGADLRQLASFLRNKDGSKALGSLYRIVTMAGHVRWVCVDHFRENYKAAAIKQLRDVVEAIGGAVNEQEGKVQLRLDSRTAARQFYEALIKARGVHELDISLCWDVTKADLQELQVAVLGARIRIMALHGAWLKGPVLDRANRSSRHDPIVHMMGNGVIQSLTLAGRFSFLERVSLAKASASSCLRRLTMDIETLLKWDSSIREKFFQILKQHPRLLELSVKCDVEAGQFSAILDSVLLVLPSLSNLTLRGEKHSLSLTYDIRNGKMLFEEGGVPLTGSGGSVPERAQFQPRRSLRLLQELDKISLSRKDPLIVCLGTTGPVFHIQKPDPLSTVSSSAGPLQVDTLLDLQSQFHVQPGQYPNLCLWGCRDDHLAIVHTIARAQKNVVFSTVDVDAEYLSDSGVELLWDLVRHVQPSSLNFSGYPPSASKGLDLSPRILAVLKTITMNLTELKISTMSSDAWCHYLEPWFPTRSGIPLLKRFELGGGYGSRIPLAVAQWVAGTIMTRTLEDIQSGAQPLEELVFMYGRMDRVSWETLVDAIEYEGLKRLSFQNSDIPASVVNRLVQRMPQGLGLRLLDLRGAVDLDSLGMKVDLQQRILACTGTEVEVLVENK